jgi:hypothetical protein
MDPKNMAILSMMGQPSQGITLDMVEMSKRNIPEKKPVGPIAEPLNFNNPTMSDSEMKAKIALSSALGNKSAQRMSQVSPPTYTFTGQEMDAYFNQPIGVPQGESGTHFMTSMGNYAVPFIQQGQNGLYFNENANYLDPEGIRFESPEQAAYFAENYKKVAPMSR